MNPRSEGLVLTIVSGVMTAAFLALAAWIYSTGNRVTALEVRQPSLEEKVEIIRQDVKDIKDYLIGPAPERP
jgi:hypothetical protein